MYGEAIRQGIVEQSLTLTCVSTEHQLADALTRPTIQQINVRIYPLWVVIPYVADVSKRP